MPGQRHSYEIQIGSGPAMPISLAELKPLAKAANVSGESVVIFVDGEKDEKLTAQYNNSARDTYKQGMFVQLTRRAYQLSSLTRDFQAGWSDSDLMDELGNIINALDDLYKMVSNRVGESKVYGPELSELETAQVD